MSSYITKTELAEALDSRFDKQTDEIVSLVQSFIQQVDERFNKLETSIDRPTNTWMDSSKDSKK